MNKPIKDELGFFRFSVGRLEFCVSLCMCIDALPMNHKPYQVCDPLWHLRVRITEPRASLLPGELWVCSSRSSSTGSSRPSCPWPGSPLRPSVLNGADLPAPGSGHNGGGILPTHHLTPSKPLPVETLLNGFLHLANHETFPRKGQRDVFCVGSTREAEERCS